MRFQIGSIIKVSEVPYHFGLVRDYQILLYVLFLERTMGMIAMIFMSTFPSMVEKKSSHMSGFIEFGMTICGFPGVSAQSSGLSGT